MCEPIWWWWIVFLTIFFSGLFGGIARFHWEKLDGGNNLSVLGFACLGVAAAFMVPLFLNTISSTLVSDSRNDPMKLFVLIGFCIAAATAAKQFIGSLADAFLHRLVLHAAAPTHEHLIQVGR